MPGVAIAIAIGIAIECAPTAIFDRGYSRSLLALRIHAFVGPVPVSVSVPGIAIAIGIEIPKLNFPHR